MLILITIHTQPILLCISERRLDQCPDRALLVWSPTTDIPDQKCKLQTYVNQLVCIHKR